MLQYKDGLSHGKGKLVLQAEGQYEGDFVEGKKHGQGTWTGPDDMVYVGQYQKDRRHGVSVCVRAHMWCELKRDGQMLEVS